jgi:hypothetical protein
MMPGIEGRLQATACGAGNSGAYHGAAYTAKVRVSVRAGDITIVREGSGTGEGKAPTPGQAHELALKGAETDATKRALERIRFNPARIQLRRSSWHIRWA